MIPSAVDEGIDAEIGGLQGLFDIVEDGRDRLPATGVDPAGPCPARRRLGFRGARKGRGSGATGEAGPDAPSPCVVSMALGRIMRPGSVLQRRIGRSQGPWDPCADRPPDNRRGPLMRRPRRPRQPRSSFSSLISLTDSW